MSTFTAPGYNCAQISDDHFTMDFDCGHDSNLSTWLNDQALAHDRADRCRVWVISPEDNHESVLAYFTLSSHSIRSAQVAKKDRDGLPGEIGHPAQLLGKFAVDSRYQGTGLSAILMSHAYSKFLEISALSGTRYMTLDVRDPELISYYSKVYGFKATAETNAGSGLTMMYKKTESIKTEMELVLADLAS